MAEHQHIYVVEDNPPEQQLLRTILEDQGFTVSTAASGKEFLKHVLKNIPDMILLDIQLPDISGYEVCEKIRKHKKTKHVPIVMLTGNDLSAEVELGFDAGADEYIIKPIDSARLLSAINSILTLNCKS
jgi:DNA-binding response OmpR family regulator